MDDRERDLFELLGPVVDAQGLDLVETGLASAGKRTVIRLVIYSGAGISHGDCARVTRAAERALEDSDAVSESYTLEVSSPGLDRVLKEEREFDVFRGRTVRLWQEDGSGVREMTGISEGWRPEAGVVVVGDDGTEAVIPWRQVSKARLVPDGIGSEFGGKGR